jgi:hypothetical protein
LVEAAWHHQVHNQLLFFFFFLMSWIELFWTSYPEIYDFKRYYGVVKGAHSKRT